MIPGTRFDCRGGNSARRPSQVQTAARDDLPINSGLARVRSTAYLVANTRVIIHSHCEIHTPYGMVRRDGNAIERDEC
ncbi:hypothetical protein CP157_03670 (plasmid) [Paracoccus marcusii]|nr:hypothetical protein CP157_03670 [Paracoccus marcusii]